MASPQEPEVQFAQRLASNEKPVRTKAIKKLRKYINVRTLKGAFTADELLKLWKGLFYCLWMQDKPLLQEELSKQISSLIHSFQSTEGKFLFMESFLQTIKREWTGIDRLRMDKFFQLVRFMFRQTFDMLKRNNWESSVVSRFLELLTLQVLQSGCDAPSGLQFHILDIYMAELAGVASAELTAEQNLALIEPFCKTAAKTKDRVLFGAICGSIFRTIVDQAPFAIQDLMKELQEGKASDSDSGQASEEEDNEESSVCQKVSSKATKQLNGGSEEEEDDDGDDEDYGDDDEGLRHLEELDSDELENEDDEDVGPVLQFDYTSLASRLLDLASRTGTPSHNRQRLYKIIKVLRNLSEGIFPQDEYPEEVSTDEDDDMFGSRKRMKRNRKNKEEVETGAPKSKKAKGEKKDSDAIQKKEPLNNDSQANEPGAGKKKKKRRRKKKKQQHQEGGNAEASQQEEVVASDKQSEASPPSKATTIVPESNTKNKKKRKNKELGKEVKSEPVADEQSPQAANISLEDRTQEATLEKQAPRKTVEKKMKKKKKQSLDLGENKAAPAVSRHADEETSAPLLDNQKDTSAATTPPLKKKKKTKTKKNQVEEERAVPETLEEDKAATVKKKKTKESNRVDLEGGDVETPTKKKRKIAVEFEYEADELAAAAVNGSAVRGSSRKPGTSSGTSDFVTFQSGATAPVPIFCKGRGAGITPTCKKSSRAPTSDSKKVTFGLTNNRTAEFRKSDRSLLLSPNGSSRVPFDPLQKPKCGVLKSPELPKNTQALSVPKRRPNASDFF